MTSRNEIMKYWVEVSPHENYVAGKARSAIIVDLVSDAWPDKTISILELGCNIGRNLHYLLQAGYSNISGVEVSPRAWPLMEKEFPDVARAITLYESSIEEVILGLRDNQFDVVVTMAVLEHIHPDSEWVFGHIARIARLGVVTVEDEAEPHSHLIFQRNYKTLFEGLGMAEDFSKNCSEYPNLEPGDFGRSAKRHWARRFLK